MIFNSAKKEILKEIKENGDISFKRFMEICLYHPKYGYYRSVKKLGREGDFFTSAHLGSLLGKVIAKVAEEYFEDDDAINVIELGAGEGLLAKDFLDLFARENIDKYAKITYHIVEGNQAVYKEIEKNLKEHSSKFITYLSLEELPEFEKVFIFSNEFFDAFPVHIVSKKKGILSELFIGYREGVYVKRFKLPSKEVIKEIEELGIEVCEDCEFEINSDIEGIYKLLSEKFKKFKMVTIDYGYGQEELYHPDRKKGTIMGYYKHKAYDNVFQYEGEMDITSHVNFDALIHYGRKYGIESVYFKNQRTFLLDNGLFEVLKEGEELSLKDSFQLKTLLLPNSMGDIFKVLIQEK